MGVDKRKYCVWIDTGNIIDRYKTSCDSTWKYTKGNGRRCPKCHKKIYLKRSSQMDKVFRVDMFGSHAKSKFSKGAMMENKAENKALEEARVKRNEKIGEGGIPMEKHIDCIIMSDLYEKAVDERTEQIKGIVEGIHKMSIKKHKCTWCDICNELLKQIEEQSDE